MCVCLYFHLSNILWVCIHKCVTTHGCICALTALYWDGGHLQGQDLAAGLRHMGPEHHPHARVLASDVRLAFPQFDVRVAQF